MDKITALLKKLGIELTADQTKQLTEVVTKEFVAAEEAAANQTKLEELTKQLKARDTDLENLRKENKSEELTKQLNELNEKYKKDTDELNAKLAAQESDHAADKLFGGYNFASERIKNSVLAEFKAKGFKLENGEFLGGKEFLEGLKKSEPDSFAKAAPALFMGATNSNVGTGETNTRAQIFEGLGINHD